MSVRLPIQEHTFDVLLSGIVIEAGQMTDERSLQKKAREAIQAGKLPNRQPESVWAGQGCGACCTVCGESLKRDELEYELEYAHAHHGADANIFHVHIKCFTAVERERHNLARTENTMLADNQASSTERLDSAAAVQRPPQTLNSPTLPDARDEGTIDGSERQSDRWEPA
jgi:hypothetical protein